MKKLLIALAGFALPLAAVAQNDYTIKEERYFFRYGDQGNDSRTIIRYCRYGIVNGVEEFEANETTDALTANYFDGSCPSFLQIPRGTKDIDTTIELFDHPNYSTWLTNFHITCISDRQRIQETETKQLTHPYNNFTKTRSQDSSRTLNAIPFGGDCYGSITTSEGTETFLEVRFTLSESKYYSEE